jgi:hypothetical protein
MTIVLRTRTVTQSQCQQGTGEEIILSRGHHLQPLVRYFLHSIDNALQTLIIGHINQEIGDPGGLEFLDSGINIKRELSGVLGIEGADKHLEQHKEVLL